MVKVFVALFGLCLLAAMAEGSPEMVFRGGALELRISGQGFITSARVGDSGNLVPEGIDAPLLRLRAAGHLISPTSAIWDGRTGNLRLGFVGHNVQIKVEQKSTHLVFEIVKVSPSADVDIAVWGSYPTTIGEQIGETIGVVQGKGLALGMQVLNPKTLGGFPEREDDVESGYSFPETASDGKHPVESYRGGTAKPTTFGSTLQAYVRNRSKTRVISNWQHEYYTAPAYRDGGLIGSKIALFGCASNEALTTIGKIEVAEGLPHPIMDGVWAKESPTAHESYLIMPYDVKNLDKYLEITKMAGLHYLYAPDDTFESWGHFNLKTDRFPNNWADMKQCVDRAKAEGIRLGIHTLSNFITPNDPYVTPVPDRRLAEVGFSSLTNKISADQTELEIADPKFFNQMSNNTLRTVRVGNELIQYDSVSGASPWRLLECKRGAFGTKKSSHPKGARIAKLMDHGYGTFLTNASLSLEVATNIARLFNETGLQQLSMDGLEGNWSTGMGQYGPALFAKAWYDHLSPTEKGQVINDASMPGSFIWHIQTRDNWGEPWYAGFRQSQTQYRLDNQRYFKRNLMPGMLGWFSVNPQTTLEDVEWLLARAAGFDAGFCILLNLDTVDKNPQGKDILAAVKAWESARRAHAFSPELIPGLQSVEHEYELTELTKDTWSLQAILSEKFPITMDTFTSSIVIPKGCRAPKLIFQIPDGVSISNWHVAVNGERLPIGQSGTDAGYRRFDVPLPHLDSGDYRLEYQGQVAAAKGMGPNIEFRMLSDDPVPLHAQRKEG